MILMISMHTHLLPLGPDFLQAGGAPNTDCCSGDRE
ncbi:hypothetical protein WwAna0716, partial [Wolbachia endosymbiont of Drosophila ananassae]